MRIHEEETHFQDAELIEVAKNLELQKDIKNYTSLRIGELFLDKYRIVKVLGRGNSSIIYLLVSNDESQKLFVLKEFFPKGLVERTDKEEIVVKSTLTKAELKNYHLMQEIFIGEAQNLMRVSSKKHPNVVHFLTAKSNINNTNYYIMSYEEGHTLKIYIENIEKSDGRKLNSKEIISLAEGLLQGISHVHSAGVYHQDIKLENILIRNDGSPIIVDFGASVLVHDKKNNKYYNTATLKYAAPEQITMDNPPKINKTTDIYNIGVLLYRLITGSFPPKADERKKSLENTGSDTYQKLIEQNFPDYNKSLLKAVDKSLNLAQSERFQNAREFEEALQKRYLEKSFIIALSVPILLALIYFAWPSSKKSIVATNKIEQKIVSEKKDTSIQTHTVTIESDISDIRYLLNGEKINKNTFLAKEGKIYTILAIAEGYEPQEYTIDYATLSKNDFVLNNTMLDNQIEDLEMGTDLSEYSEEKEDAPISSPKKDEDEIALYFPTPVDEEETVAEIPTIPVVDEVTSEFVAPIVSVNKPIVKRIDSEDKLQEKMLLRQKRELEKKKALQQSRAKAQRKKAEKRRVKKRKKAAKEKAEQRRKATLAKQKNQKRRIAKKRALEKRALEKRALEKRKAKKRKAKKRNQSTSSSVWYCVARTGNIIKSAKKSTRSSAKSTALWSCKKYSKGKGVCRVSCYLWK